MANGRIRKAVDISIKTAVQDGNLNIETHAAPIAMLRLMADYLDGNQNDPSAFKAITPASFLNYCETLGFTPDSELLANSAKPAKNKLVAFTSSAKFSKASNG